jgi:hypothetical protein
MWHALLQLLRAIWHRLCGYGALHTIDRTERTERQQLLSAEAPGSAAASPEPLAHAVVAAEPLLPCTLIVMRHGHRCAGLPLTYEPD